MRAWCATMFVVLIALFAPIVSAAETDAAAAEVFFQKGRDAMSEEDFETACQMFAESLALDPAVGTVMNLATCEEKRGHLTASWERWHQALRLLDNGDDREEFATSQLASIELRLGQLTIRLEKNAPKGLIIRRDGVVLGKASFGEALPVDPGQHLIMVESNRHESRSYTVSLEAGEHKELVVAPGKEKPQTQATSRGEWRKIAGFSAVGVGVFGLGAAIISGAMLPAQDRKVEENCPGKVCDETGTQAKSNAKTLLAINTAGFIVAGVGLLSGGILLLTLPRQQAATGSEKKSPAASKQKASSLRRPASLNVALVGTGINVFGDF